MLSQSKYLNSTQHIFFQEMDPILMHDSIIINVSQSFKIEILNNPSKNK